MQKTRRTQLIITGAALVMIGAYSPPVASAQSAGEKLEFYHDFRGNALPPDLDFHGGGADGKYFYTEPEGFQIKLPKDWKHPWGGSGLATTFGIEGDFEITTTVEIVNAEPPTAGFGTGVRMYIKKADSAEAITLCRIDRPGNQQVILCDRKFPAQEAGKYQIVEQVTPCAETKLKLRIKRRDKTVYCLWAPAQSNAFTEIYRVEFGAEPIHRVILTAINGRQPIALDVRLVDLRIRGGLTTGSPIAALNTDDSSASSSVLWLLGIAVAILIIFLGTWFYLRRHRDGANAGDDEDEDDDEKAESAPHHPIKRRKRAIAPGSTRRLLLSLLPMLIAFLLLGWLIPTWQSGAAANKGFGSESEPRKKRDEYFLSFKNKPDNLQRLKIIPAKHRDFVKAEAEGVRITIPKGLDGFRDGVRLSSEFAVKGNFEITIGFEILAEPDVELLSETGGLGLVVESKAATKARAAVYRTVYSQVGSAYSTWMSLQKNKNEKPEKVLSYLPTQAKKGHLRLARIGSTLYYYIANEDGCFNLINRRDFGSDDLIFVRIIATSGGPKAFLDARVTHLRIRAETLPATASSAQTESTDNESSSLPIVVIILMVMSALLGMVLHGRELAKRKRLGAVSIMLGVSSCALVFLIGIWISGRIASFFGSSESLPTMLQELALSFKGNDNNQRFDFIGPGAAKCVKFAEDGLRISLPAGWPGTRPVTGVTTPLALKGDFEMTMHYEILNEPEKVKQRTGTRLSFVIFLNTPKPTVATINRSVGESQRKVFVAWMSRWKPNEKKPENKSRNISTSATTGELRLVRKGAKLSYFVNESPESDFVLLREYDFGDDDVKEIRIAGSTGDRDAMLDARVTHLHIRAQGIPGAALPGQTTQSGSSSLLMLGIIVLALVVAGLVALNLRRTTATDTESPSHQNVESASVEEVETIAFICSACNKKLRAKSKVAGKKIKCPKCGAEVVVEETAIKKA